MISYYSDRGGLGGVSIVTEKGEVTVSQLLIKGATVKDQVQFGFLKSHHFWICSAGISFKSKSNLVFKVQITVAKVFHFLNNYIISR